ncbi:MAG: hypothetical protein AAGI01_08525, partial [Myxococcota bacterium]
HGRFGALAPSVRVTRDLLELEASIGLGVAPLAASVNAAPGAWYGGSLHLSSVARGERLSALAAVDNSGAALVTLSGRAKRGTPHTHFDADIEASIVGDDTLRAIESRQLEYDGALRSFRRRRAGVSLGSDAFALQLFGSWDDERADLHAQAPEAGARLGTQLALSPSTHATLTAQHTSTSAQNPDTQQRADHTSGATFILDKVVGTPGRMWARGAVGAGARYAIDAQEIGARASTTAFIDTALTARVQGVGTFSKRRVRHHVDAFASVLARPAERTQRVLDARRFCAGVTGIEQRLVMRGITLSAPLSVLATLSNDGLGVLATPRAGVSLSSEAFTLGADAQRDPLDGGLRAAGSAILSLGPLRASYRMGRTSAAALAREQVMRGPSHTARTFSLLDAAVSGSKGERARFHHLASVGMERAHHSVVLEGFLAPGGQAPAQGALARYTYGLDALGWALSVSAGARRGVAGIPDDAIVFVGWTAR